MPSARRDDDGAAGGLIRRRQVRRDAGFVDVGEDTFAALGDADFHFAGLAFRTGRAIRPEQDFFARFNRACCAQQEQRCESNVNSSLAPAVVVSSYLFSWFVVHIFGLYSPAEHPSACVSGSWKGKGMNGRGTRRKQLCSDRGSRFNSTAASKWDGVCISEPGATGPFVAATAL
jgi:hypothetical protein